MQTLLKSFTYCCIIAFFYTTHITLIHVIDSYVSVLIYTYIKYFTIIKLLPSLVKKCIINLRFKKKALYTS